MHAWLRYCMRETSISGNLNCVYLCSHARVCEENQLELENKLLHVKIFVMKGSTLKGCRRTVTLPIKLNFMTRIFHSVKVLVL